MDFQNDGELAGGAGGAFAHTARPRTSSFVDQTIHDGSPDSRRHALSFISPLQTPGRCREFAAGRTIFEQWSPRPREKESPSVAEAWEVPAASAWADETSCTRGRGRRGQAARRARARVVTAQDAAAIGSLRFQQRADGEPSRGPTCRITSPGRVLGLGRQSSFSRMEDVAPWSTPRSAVERRTAVASTAARGIAGRGVAHLRALQCPPADKMAAGHSCAEVEVDGRVACASRDARTERERRGPRRGERLAGRRSSQTLPSPRHRRAGANRRCQDWRK